MRSELVEDQIDKPNPKPKQNVVAVTLHYRVVEAETKWNGSSHLQQQQTINPTITLSLLQESEVKKMGLTIESWQCVEYGEDEREEDGEGISPKQVKKKLLTDNTDKHFSGHWDLEK